MSDRDAFGREKGEDSLAEMGWSNWPKAGPEVTAEPVPEAQPVMTAGSPLADAPEEPARTPPPAPVKYRRPRRRRVRGLFIPLFLVGILAFGILGATSVFQAGQDVVDQVEDAIREGTAQTQRGGTLSGASLVRPAALKAALAKLPAGDLELLRVAPERIDAQVLVDGRMHNVQVKAGGEVTDVFTSSAGRGESVKVNVNAPARIIRKAARRSGRRPGAVDYLVLGTVADKAQWELFFKDGLHYRGSATGKSVKRVG